MQKRYRHFITLDFFVFDGCFWVRIRYIEINLI